MSRRFYLRRNPWRYTQSTRIGGLGVNRVASTLVAPRGGFPLYWRHFNLRKSHLVAFTHGSMNEEQDEEEDEEPGDEEEDEEPGDEEIRKLLGEMAELISWEASADGMWVRSKRKCPKTFLENLVRRSHCFRTPPRVWIQQIHKGRVYLTGTRRFRRLPTTWADLHARSGRFFQPTKRSGYLSLE